jgi:membrane associated rhomboid family serine protease
MQSASPFSSLPTIVKNLLIINGLFFFAAFVFQDRNWANLNQVLGLYYPESSYFKPFQLVSYAFMHASINHLVYNMFSLWMFGTILEHFWGPKRFLTFYMITTLGAAVTYLTINYFEVQTIQSAIETFSANPGYDQFLNLMKTDPDLLATDQISSFVYQWSQDINNTKFLDYAKEIAGVLIQRKLNIPMVGASGAVFGLLLANGMLFPNREVFLFFIPIPIKIKYMVVFLGVMELWEGLGNNPGDQVAHFAHLGGMLFGFIAIKYWNKTDRVNFF